MSLIEALFWGKPVVTFSKRNSPEIYYFKEGYNGYRVNSVEEFEQKISDLLKNSAKYNEMAENVWKTYEDKAHISKMFEGFKEAIKFVEEK